MTKKIEELTNALAVIVGDEAAESVRKHANSKGLRSALERAKAGTLNYLAQYAEYASLWSEKERQKRLRKRFDTLFRTYAKKHTFTEEQQEYIAEYKNQNFAM